VSSEPSSPTPPVLSLERFASPGCSDQVRSPPSCPSASSHQALLFKLPIVLDWGAIFLTESIDLWRRYCSNKVRPLLSRSIGATQINLIPYCELALLNTITSARRSTIPRVKRPGRRHAYIVFGNDGLFAFLSGGPKVWTVQAPISMRSNHRLSRGHDEGGPRRHREMPTLRKSPCLEVYSVLVIN